MTPPSSTTQLPNTYLRQFFYYLGARPELLQKTSETPESLARLESTNSFKDYCQFYRNAALVLDDPAIGLRIGQVNQLANMHGPLTTVVMQSHDIAECLHLMERFMTLRLPIVRARWFEEADNVGLQIELASDDVEVPASVLEALMLAAVGILSAVSQGKVVPARIELNYAEPTYVSRYAAAFGTANILFSQDRLAVIISRTDAAYATGVESDPELRQATIKRCEELLRGTRAAHSTTDRVRQIFANNPGHLWKVSEVARHLNISSSTLQRRLAREDTSYRNIQEQWLKQEALTLLAEERLTIETIAVLLGYSDVSNFRHACRRWFGASPQGYRRQLESQFRAQRPSA